MIEINICKMPTTEFENAFQQYKTALLPFIEKAFTWDEAFQKNRFQTHYQPDWFHSVTSNSEQIGYVCFFENDQELHVSLLIIFKKFQSKGYGKHAMKVLHEKADTKFLNVTLSTFKSNSLAVEFYKKIGYIVKGEDDHFYDMAFKKFRK